MAEDSAAPCRSALARDGAFREIPSRASVLLRMPAYGKAT